MIKDIDNNSVVICSNNIKKQLLLNRLELRNIKFYTLKEFINNYYGTYNIDAIYYVMKSRGFNYDVAKEYLDNIFYDYEPLKDLYNDLECNNLLDVNKLFKKEIEGKKIYVIGYYNLDKYINDLFNSLNVTFIELNSNYNHDVYEFDTLEDELVYVINDIMQNHKDRLNDVYLVNTDNSYNNVLKRLFNFFHININMKERNSIFSTKEVQDFIKELKINNKMNLEIINNDDIKNKVIDIINKYNIKELDEYYVSIIENEIKNTFMDSKSYSDGVNVIDIDDIFLEDKYYYIMNFNQGSVPKIFHDDKLIKDLYRKEIGLNTSLDNLNNYKKMVISKLNNYKNVTITYKLKDDYKDYTKSPLIDELSLNIINDNKKYYNYSNKFNKIELAKILDNYIRRNEDNINLKDLYVTYKDIDYMKYDNNFKNVDYKLLREYLNKDINISYSSMDNFFKCRFRYYINNILNLEEFEDTIQTMIGKLFHHCLSKMYDDDFDLKKEYNIYLKDKKLSNKEKFYTDKLYSELELIIDTIKKQDNHSIFNKTLTEHNVLIKKDDTSDINVKGFIDKVRILNQDNITYASIIDYKTGNTDLTLDNITYGLNMQLPMYLYLIKKDMDNVSVIGFYLQKILENKKINSKDPKKEELDSLKLIGYTIDNEELIEKFDNTYNDSEVIKSMKLTSNGFSRYAKLISEEEINKIIQIVDEHINEVISSIKEGDFKINPKRVDNDLVGCKYCKYKDLCFRKEENIENLRYKTKEEILNS